MNPRESLLQPARSAAARAAVEVYARSVEAVRADRLIQAAVRRTGDRLGAVGLSIDLRGVRRIWLAGAGKASALMAQAVEPLVGERLAGGVVVTKEAADASCSVVRVLEAAHPVPDDRSVEAGRAIHKLVSDARPDDLVIFLLSGGASALMELPEEGTALADLQRATSLLLRAGANIQDLNSVRACLSRLKAGGIARAAGQTRLLCLVLSDVLGNPLEVIGSGPCLPHRRDPAAALEVLRKYDLDLSVPPAVLERLNAMTNEPLEPALRPDHVLIGDIWSALNAAREAAESIGLRPLILTGWLQGEARDAGRFLGAIARDLPKTAAARGPNCLIFGGETTVTVRGEGMGGRSQELAAAAAGEIAGAESIALLAAGTDGTDGPTDSAGAVVDGETAGRAVEAGVSLADALARNDSYRWLDGAGALLRTGPTHTNVNDLVVLVAMPEPPA